MNGDPLPPTTMRIESKSGPVLAHLPVDHPLGRGDVMALDGSDVRYQVVEAEQETGGDGDEPRVVVEVFDGSADGRVVRRPASAPAATLQTVSSTDGVELALHHFGGDGPALLICHATGFHALAYAPLARALRGHFDVWAVDLRGHGASTAPDNGDFAWRGMAEDVMATLDTIGSTSVVGVGHSMGGAAILLAEKARPGSFEAAYLFEPIVFPADRIEGRGENPMSGPARKRRPVFPSKQAARERYGSRPPLNELRLDALAAYVEHGFVETGPDEVRLACEPEHEARTFEAEDKMTFDLLDGLSLRLVVAAGAPMTGMSPADHAPETAERVDGALLYLHDDLGHFGPLEDPDRIAAEIIDWLTPTAGEAIP